MPGFLLGEKRVKMNIQYKVKNGDFLVNPKLYTLLDVAETPTEKNKRQKALDGELRGMRNKLYNAVVDHYNLLICDVSREIRLAIKKQINQYLGYDEDQIFQILEDVERILLDYGWATYVKYPLNDIHPIRNPNQSLYLWPNVDEYVKSIPDYDVAPYAIYRIELDGEQTLTGIIYDGRFFTDTKFLPMA